MPDKIPFDEDMMTLIMGIGEPEKPGQHGRTMIPAPENKPIDVITQIRDLCEDFLRSIDKGDGKPEGAERPNGKADDAQEKPSDEEE